jgi:hypothetical protein
MYENAAGEITYSNVTAAPPKDSKKIRCFREKKVPAVSAQPQPKASSNFPSVDSDTQRRRDDERRTILERELDAEQKRLSAARGQLEEQESVRTGNERNYQRFLDRVQPFKDAVQTHENNVQAIQSELDNLR